MKHTRIFWSVIVSFALSQTLFGQGFVNMDFETASVTATPPGQGGGVVDPALAFPGWSVGGSGTFVFYNGLSVGAPAVSLIGPDFPNGTGFTPLQGSYSVLFAYFNIAGPAPTLSQTGMIPADANSISFLVGANWTDAAVSIDGIPIPLVSVTGGRVAGDVSAFAGSVALLTFSTATGSPNAPDLLYFDDVQFSPSSVPEPSVLSIFISGTFVICYRVTRPNQSPEPTAVGAVSFAVAVHVASRRWLSFFRWRLYT